MKQNFKKFSLAILALWMFCAVFASFIANEKPLFSYHQRELYFFPETLSEGFNLPAPIPYSPNTIDFSNANYKSPLEEQSYTSIHYRHWLGTDNLGRDVFSNLIHGCRTSFLIGIGSIFLASLIGILIGAIAAFYGDNLMVSQRSIIRGSILFLIGILVFFIVIPWNVSSVSFFLKAVYFLTLIISLYLINKLLKQKDKRTPFKQVPISFDLYIGRFIETFDAIPLLFILIALNSFISPSVLSSILIIGLVAWPTLAQFTRAEFLKRRNTAYVENSIALGFKDLRIILFHILPNAMPAVIIRIIFLLSATVLIESTLAFMGLGINSSASWGEMLNAARSNYGAWWLTLFPGMAIFLIISACSSLAEQLNK